MKNADTKQVLMWSIFSVSTALFAGVLLFFSHMTSANADELASRTANILYKSSIKNVILETSLGPIALELFAEDAPKTVENFINLADEGYYEGIKFHRVIPNFMIQTGDPLTKTARVELYGTGGPGYTFADEINDHKIVRGTLAMANAGPNTNGSQFFIVTAEATPWLDGKHTVFGKVISGMEVVDAIEALPTNERDLPLDNVVIKRITLR